jgi:hypothetical protein
MFNGNSLTNFAQRAMPGQLNLIGWGDTGSAISGFSLGGDTLTTRNFDNPWIAWVLEITWSVPTIFPVAVDTHRAPVYRGQHPLLGFHGPVEVDRTLAFDVGQTWTSHFANTFDPFSDVPETGSFTGEYVGPFNSGSYSPRMTQGFVARSTQLSALELNVQGNVNGSPPAWPLDAVLHVQVFPDDNGVFPGGGTPIQEVTFPLAGQRIWGPVFVYFDPAIELVLEQTYWISVYILPTPPSTDPGTFGISLMSYACHVPQVVPFLEPIVGHVEQSSQVYVGNSFTFSDQLFFASVYDVGTLAGGCNPITQAPKTSCYDIGIGTEGLFFEGKTGIWSSPPNGMGAGGVPDENALFYPDAVPVAGWCKEDVYTDTTPDYILHSAYDSSVMTYVENGLPWIVAVDFETGGTTSWGPIPGSRLAGPVDWPWSGKGAAHVVPGNGASITDAGIQAVRRSNGSFVAMIRTDPQDFGELDQYSFPITYDRVGFQTLGGSDSSAEFGEFHYFFNNVKREYSPITLLVDHNDIVHFFFADTTDNHISPVGFWPIYHQALSPDGVLGPLVPWDCLPAFKNGIQQGSWHPGGGVALPYLNHDSCFMLAIWPSNVFATEPTIQELPKVVPTGAGDRRVPWELYQTDFPFGTPPTPGALIYVGSVGYLFCQDSVGISVARYDGAWSGFAVWTEERDYLGRLLIPNGLSANYLEGVNRIGVVFGMSKPNPPFGPLDPWTFFRWFDDGLSYPSFSVTDLCHPNPCAPVSTHTRAWTQVIG